MTKLENVVSELFQQKLFSDFVIDDLKYSDNKRKGKELADLLYIFGDTLIILQAKTRTLKDSTMITSALEIGRIEQKIAEAIGQLKSSINQLKINELFELVTVRGYHIAIDKDKIKKIIGIVVIDVENSRKESIIDNIEVVNGFDEQFDIPIHIFRVIDLETILKELDTFPDFLEYLSTRKSLIVEKRIVSYNGELDLLATYLFNRKTIDAVLNSIDDKIVIEPGLWESGNNKELNSDYLEYIKSSYGIDEIIKFLHNAVGYKVKDELDSEYEGSVEGYQRSAYELACLNRMMRKEISDLFIKKAKKAMLEGHGYSFIVLPEIESSIVVLSFRGNRPNRRKFLFKLCSCAYVSIESLSRDVHCKKVIGIATEPINHRNASYDVIVLENAEFKNTEELKEEAKKLFIIK